MRYLRGFGRFWFDFIVGDDWRIAAGVVAALGLGALALRAGLSARPAGRARGRGDGRGRDGDAARCRVREDDPTRGTP